MNVITIHQPEHLSYLGFYEKVSRCETLVILDSVDYRKNYFQNRNRIYTNNGIEYITVPIVSGNKSIMDTKIDYKNWKIIRHKNLRKIELAYKKAKYFNQYYDDFRESYLIETEFLTELNIELINFVLNSLEIRKKIIRSSSLNTEGKKSKLIADICIKMGARVYIAGQSGQEYLNENDFINIKIDYQNFVHPIYTQYGKAIFLSNLSVIDALFNVGIEIMNIIKIVQGVKKCKISE